MKVTIEVPDKAIDNALEGPHSRYWAESMDWDTKTRKGYVKERENGDGPKVITRRFGSRKIAKAIQIMAGGVRSDVLARLLSDETDGPDGDIVLQLAALGELRYG